MREEELAYIEVYNTDKRNEELTPADIKNRIRDYKITVRALNESSNAPAEQVEKDEFKFSMLDNGWNLDDLELIDAFYDAVKSAPNEQAGNLGNYYINLMKTTVLNTYRSRQELLAEMFNVVADFTPQDQEKLIPLFRQVTTKRPLAEEYPNDRELHEELRKEGAFNPYYVAKISGESEQQKAQRKKLRERGIVHNANISEESRNNIRRRGEYVLPKLTQEELDNHELNQSQRKYHVNMIQRDAIKLIYGGHVYDQLDEKYKSDNVQDRTVPMFNARGNRQMDEGGIVLELDFAGTGYAQTRKEHHGLSGKVKDEGAGDKVMTDALRAQYGPRINKVGNIDTTDHHLRRKETIRDGKKKIRYTFPGPSADGLGLLDQGAYSITNNTKLGLEIAKQFLEPYMKTWMENKGNPNFVQEPIHINISGHSRGAVTASETVAEISDWLYSLKGYEGFADLVSFDLVQRDPVPGPDVIDARRRRPDLSKYPNVNSTTIFTILADKESFGLGFRNQRTRGQDRLIIGTTPHGVGLEGVDMSQTGEAGDGMAHQYGYFDMESGAYYRGSGVNDLPLGVYISDDKRNLFRVTRYSQVDHLIRLVDPDGRYNESQNVRQSNIRESVKNWFVDHPDTLLYKSEEERQNNLMEMAEKLEILKNSTNPEYAFLKEQIAREGEMEDPEKIVLLREQTLARLREYISTHKSHTGDIDKKNDGNPEDITKNGEWMALCDLYILMQTEDNYIKRLSKTREDYRTFSDEVTQLGIHCVNYGILKDDLLVMAEGNESKRISDVMALTELMGQAEKLDLNKSPRQYLALEKSIKNILEVHRGEGRLPWSSDKKLDERFSKVAERIYGHIRTFNMESKTLFSTQEIADKSLSQITADKYKERDNSLADWEKRGKGETARTWSSFYASSRREAVRYLNKLMTLGVNEERDSRQFTDMKKALMAVVSLDDSASLNEYREKYLDLTKASFAYANKIAEKGGGTSYFFGKCGAQRLTLANNIKAMAMKVATTKSSMLLDPSKALDVQMGQEHIELNGGGLDLNVQGDFAVVNHSRVEIPGPMANQPQRNTVGHKGNQVNLNNLIEEEDVDDNRLSFRLLVDGDDGNLINNGKKRNSLPAKKTSKKDPKKESNKESKKSSKKDQPKNGSDRFSKISMDEDQKEPPVKQSVKK